MLYLVLLSASVSRIFTDCPGAVARDADLLCGAVTEPLCLLVLALFYKRLARLRLWSRYKLAPRPAPHFAHAVSDARLESPWKIEQPGYVRALLPIRLSN